MNPVKVTTLLLCVLTGCSTAGTKEVAEMEVPAVSLCAITENPKAFLGKVTKVRARYTVIKENESFFVGTDCPAKSLIAEGSRAGSDRSVSKFQRAGDMLCKERQVESLCTLKADLVLDVKIRIDTDGELVADPIHVDSFTYLPVKLEQ